MEEISTPVETVTAPDTSVVAEPDTTSQVDETVADTSETQSTTEPETVAETEETAETTTEPSANGDKLFAGKYKSVEELEKGYKEAEKSFSKVAELEKRIKEFEAKQPKYINENGKFNPEIKAEYELRVDNEEFMSYVNLASRLDSDTRTEVENLLSDAQRVYNPKNKQAYYNKLAEAKNYFNSEIVESIAKNKLNRENEMSVNIRQMELSQRQKRADEFAAAIQNEPELYDLVNPESETHSPEMLTIVKSMFDAYQNIDIPTTLKAIQTLKDLGVKQYLAKQQLETAKGNANVKTGETVSTQTTPTTPSKAEVSQNYQKYIDKYMKNGLSFSEAMAKVDSIIMKG